MQKGLLTLVFFLGALSGANGKGFSNYFKANDSLKTRYITSYADKLAVYAYGISKSSNFAFFDDEENKSIEYAPNENLNLGLGFNYKWLGLSAAFNFGFINNDDAYYGKTYSPLTLQLDMFPRSWIINMNTQLYKGYYWENPDKFNDLFDPPWSIKDSLLLRPDMVTFSLGFSGFYAFNKDKFSMKAAFTNTELQKKSAGSLLAGAGASAYLISADEPILPEPLNELYPDTYRIGKISSALLGVSVGYSYSLVIKENFYANALLLVGINYQHVTEYELDEKVYSQTHHASSNSVFRFAIGYNRPRYYFGINFNMANYVLQSQTKTNFIHADTKFRFFYGRRFDVSKWQKKKKEL